MEFCEFLCDFYGTVRSSKGEKYGSAGLNKVFEFVLVFNKSLMSLSWFLMRDIELFFHWSKRPLVSRPLS